MIAVLKKGTTQAQTEHLMQWLKNMNLDVHMITAEDVLTKAEISVIA